jgi:hypothetical protein
MTTRRKNRPPVSKRQAGLFGLEASGKDVMRGMTSKQARDKLRGVKISKLPDVIGNKKRKK